MSFKTLNSGLNFHIFTTKAIPRWLQSAWEHPQLLRGEVGTASPHSQAQVVEWREEVVEEGDRQERRSREDSRTADQSSLSGGDQSGDG